MSSCQDDESAVDLQVKNEVSVDAVDSEVSKTRSEEVENDTRRDSKCETDTGGSSVQSETSRKRSAEDDDTRRDSKRLAVDNDEDSSSNVPSDLSTGPKENTVTEAEKTVDHTALVANHYNLLEEKSLEFRDRSRIIFMRNFNNWIKSMLINEFINKLSQQNRGNRLQVMDMCCGKGGDLLKWLKGNVRHLICADIADVSIEQCQNRYDDLSKKDQRRRGFEPVFSAEFIVADCTKVRLREKFKDPSIHLDLVSCQFAMHYSFESLPQAEMMLKNASETLKPGGYFIGTIPDAYDIVARLHQSETNKFGNEIYSVELQSDSKDNLPLFGAKYNFRLEGVVNCPEFLVYLPLFKKLALSFGLKLVLFERFEDFYERMKNEGRSLLNSMQGLETYPECHDAPLVSKKPDDYAHAVQYMQKNTGHRKIGTLSKSEWEATSLYAVFAFQKMKTSWDKNGKPVYEDL